ncbi:MAG: cobalamin-dependent protein [Planctomycetota bacterium]|nr:cobalamin-dependent protein [Planctomycetota bacterium]
MNTHFTAQILRTSADGIAGLATARLFEQHPDGLVDDFSAWKAHLKDQTLQLAAALQSQNPGAFANHMDWTRVAFQGRGIPNSAVLQAMECLDEVACDSIPSGMVAELTPYLEAARQRLTQAKPSTASCLMAEEPFHTLAHDFIGALRKGEEPQATDSILKAHSDEGLSIQEIVDGILSPSLKEMGRLWHLGEATIAEEHFVTQATHKVLTHLLALAERKAWNGKTALLSSVEGDDHSFGVQVVSGYLQIAGWRTVCLGVDTPAAELARAAHDFRADVILLGATMDVQVHGVIESIQRIREQSPASKVLVGGSAFARDPELWQKVGADHQAKNGQDAVRLANTYVG